MPRVIISGITTGFKPTDPVSALPQRLEWHTFAQNIDFLTLYVRALKLFQDADKTKPVSFFQIAGIHGLPYAPWDSLPDGKPPQGYCHHKSNGQANRVLILVNTFPSWHRPYLALYEQQLASYFPDIVQLYQKGSRGEQLANAAQVWRLPYWDWALYPTMPDEWSSSEIKIYGPDGNITSFHNPFAAYKFPHPNLFDGPSATSRDTRANENLTANSRQFKPWVHELFNTPPPQNDPWGQISNSAWENVDMDQGHLSSFESIHDHIHDFVGGTMRDITVAAFDPIFWLHHCNVDRIFALWCAAFPDIYVPTEKTSEGIYNLRDASLEPFSKSQSDYITSGDCYSTSTYGYTYPEIAAAGPVSGRQLSDAILQTVDRLYGPSTTIGERSEDVPMESLAGSMQAASLKPVEKEPGDWHIPEFHLFGEHKNPHPGPPSAPPRPSGVQAIENVPPHNPGPVPSGSQGSAIPPHRDYKVTPETYRKWIANITLEKYALGGSGRIAFFLGPENEIPADPKEWYTSPLYVGSFSVFAHHNPTDSGCSNCKDQAERHLRVGGTVHLTDTLISHQIPLQGDEPIEYLSKNLHWRAANFKDENIPTESIPSLKVVVQSAGFNLPPGGVRPVTGPWTRHALVTRGKPGGVNHANEF